MNPSNRAHNSAGADRRPTDDSQTAEDQPRRSRRQLFQELGKLAAGVAAAAAPLAVELTGQNALAGDSPTTVEDVLNFALTLEYLEAEYYTMGVDSGVLDGSDADGRAAAIYTEIRDHEQAHVALLENALGLSAGENKPEFDFTVGGTFAPFDDYATFVLLSQAFEDTGVRAYKGQAPNLLGEDALTTALQIHAVEARHAAIVRRLRGLQGWIPQAQPGAPEPVQPVYAGEDNTTQLSIDLSDVLDFDEVIVTESFDEPLSMDEVLQIATPFIASGG